jgi:hypothetical protein
MFCTDEREIAIFDLLVERFPKTNPNLLELIAWCGVNRPDRLQELLEQHKNDDESNMVELDTLDIKAMCNNKLSVE